MSTLTHACHCGALYSARWKLVLHRGFCTVPKPRAHFVPPENSWQAWDVGPSRCYTCLAHELDSSFQRPCPGHRPAGVELA